MDHVEFTCSICRAAFERGAEVRQEFGDWIRVDGNEPFSVERLGALMRDVW